MDVAGGRVGVSVAEAYLPRVGQDILETLQGGICPGDQERAVARVAARIDHLEGDLAAGPVHGLHGGLVAHPGDVDLLGGHAPDSARVIGVHLGFDHAARRGPKVVKQRPPRRGQGFRGLAGQEAHGQGIRHEPFGWAWR